MGKCTHPDTFIQTDSGPIMAKDLDNTKHKIYTFDENDKKIKLTSNFNTFDNGKKDIYRIETRMGNIDKVTFNHPYYVFRDGSFQWIDSCNLVVGDRVLVTKTYEELFSEEHYNPDFYRLLGYLVSDGGTNYKDQARFTNFDPVIVKNINTILKRSFNAKLSRYAKGNYGIKSKSKNVKNLVNELCDKHELRSLAINKKIPKTVFSASKENTAEFISSAFDCDGWVDNNSIGYCSSSYILANGMKHLLKKFGIQSKLRQKFVKYKDSKKVTYQVEIRGLENLKVFNKEIVMILKGKKLSDLISKSSKGHNNYEFLTLEINKYVLEKAKEKNINFLKTHGINVKKTERISIDKLKKVNNILNDPFLDQFLNKDFILDEIKEISFIANEQSIGVTVEDTHTFITDDIWTHNTEILCIDALHFCDTTEIKNANVMIVVPYQNLLEEIFDRLKSMLNGDESAFKESFRSTKKPFSITLQNGTKILGFTAGSGSGSEGASTRGQRCDKLFLDECDYLKNGDIETVMALKMEHSNFEVQVTSTPSSLPGKFREMCLIAPDFKDFHFPSTLMSSYQDQEQELKRMYNKDGFAREVLAEFYENNNKVFPTDEIRNSFKSFKYISSFAEQAVPQEWVYSIGEI